MNPNTQLTDDTIDLRELFFSLLIQWKLIIFCTVFALVCAVAYLKVAKKTYSVDAKIQIIDNKLLYQSSFFTSIKILSCRFFNLIFTFWRSDNCVGLRLVVISLSYLL